MSAAALGRDELPAAFPSSAAERPPARPRAHAMEESVHASTLAV